MLCAVEGQCSISEVDLLSREICAYILQRRIFLNKHIVLLIRECQLLNKYIVQVKHWRILAPLISRVLCTWTAFDGSSEPLSAFLHGSLPVWAWDIWHKGPCEPKKCCQPGWDSALAFLTGILTAPLCTKLGFFGARNGFTLYSTPYFPLQTSILQ